MRIVRFLAQGKIRYGQLEEGGSVRAFWGNPFTRFKSTDDTYNLNEVRLLSPCTPSKIICLGLNYRSHAEETKLPIPEVPLIFMKPSTAVIGPEDKIVLPLSSGRVDYEGELAIVIGRRAKYVPQDRAADFIMGYTCLNDVSERHNQRDDGQWTRAKGYDTFAPLGPCIQTELDASNVKLETFLNGELRQSARTNDLIFPIAKIVNFVSGVMTLLPGDVIATGTPSGIGRMKEGDRVEVTIEGIGALKNSVVHA